MRSQAIRISRLEYEAHNSEVWLLYYFDESSGGYVVIHRLRLARSLVSKNERMKLEKERSMAMVFARVGHRVVMLEEIPGVSSPDVLIDGIPAELKSLNSPVSIVKSAKRAVRKQRAQLVLIEFNFNVEEVIERIEGHIRTLQTIGIHGFYYESGIELITGF